MASSIRCPEPTDVLDALRSGVVHAGSLGVRVAIVVVGPDGGLLGGIRHPDAFLTASGVATAKAFTARNFGRRTSELAVNVSTESQRNLAVVDRRLCFVAGGVPLGDGVEAIAAVGVSGGSPDQDEQVATHVRDALARAVAT